MVCETSGTFSNINPFTHRHQVLQEISDEPCEHVTCKNEARQHAGAFKELDRHIKDSV